MIPLNKQEQIGNIVDKLAQKAVTLMDRVEVTTRADIYAEALKYFRKSCPQYQPATKWLADRMGMGENTLYQKIRDESHHFSPPEIEQFFRLTGFREGFILWQIITFNLEGK